MFQVYKALSTIIHESNAYHHTQQNASLTWTLYSFTVYSTNFNIQVLFQAQAHDKYSGLEERVCFLSQILEDHSN